MARNEQRRRALADAAITVLAAEGPRGLTHRRIDAAAGTPRGTASNYFATRDAVVAGIVERIGERLAPDAAVGKALEAKFDGIELYAAYLRDVARRLLEDRESAVGLFELRLEAARSPEVAAALDAWRGEAFAADLAHRQQRGLPGGADEVRLFHFALDGLVLEAVTRGVDDVDAVVDDLARRILSS